MQKKLSILLIMGSLSIIFVAYQNMGYLGANTSSLRACSSSEKAAALSAPKSKSDYGYSLKCSLNLRSTEKITRLLVIEDRNSSGLTLNCNGGSIDVRNSPGNRQLALVIRPKRLIDSKGNPYWLPPQNIQIKNCKIYGGINVQGMSASGEGADLKASSRLDGNHTARAQQRAAKNILLSNLDIYANQASAIYVSPGVTNLTLENSRVLGSTRNGPGIYLDAESADNMIRNNMIAVSTYDREQLAIDGSARNKVIGNYFSNLSKGGIYLYRNCGEGGTIRHQSPTHNEIINNTFYYNTYSGSNPSIFIASRNGNRNYCHLDNGFPWGSSANNMDLARHNIIVDNQFRNFATSKALKVNDNPNKLMNNTSVSNFLSRASACYLKDYDVVINSGKTYSKQVSVSGRCSIKNYSCSDGILRQLSDTACPVATPTPTPKPEDYEFHEVCYLERYPDIKRNWVDRGRKAIDHWLLYGQKEGRKPNCDGFNQQCYLQRYPDIKRNWVDRGRKAVDHWTQIGRYEGRKPGC